MEASDKSDKNLLTRRYFLESVTVGTLGLTAIGGLILSGEYLAPNVVREPPTKFNAGPPENFPPGSVTLNKEQKVFIVRANEGYFYALSAVCTHLGCITNWKPDEGIVACPCHGSKFDREGRKLEGPAPRPLPRFSIVLDDRGSLIVDRSVVVGDDTTLKV